MSPFKWFDSHKAVNELTSFTENVVVNRPVEEVWRFIDDPSNISKMYSEPVEMKQLSPGPRGVGTMLEERWSGRHITNVERITEYEPNRKYSAEAVSGPLKGTRMTICVEEIEGKTKATITYDVKLSGFRRLVGPFAAPRFRKELVTELANAKRVLESQPMPKA